MATKIKRLLELYDAIALSGIGGITRQELFERVTIAHGKDMRTLERDLKELRRDLELPIEVTTEVPEGVAAKNARVVYYLDRRDAPLHHLLGSGASRAAFESAGGRIGGRHVASNQLQLLAFATRDLDTAVAACRQHRKNSRFVYVGELHGRHFFLEVASQSADRLVVHLGRCRVDQSFAQRWADSEDAWIGLSNAEGLSSFTGAAGGHVEVSFDADAVSVTDVSSSATDGLLGVDIWRRAKAPLTQPARYSREALKQPWRCQDAVTRFSAGGLTFAVLLPAPPK